MGERADWAEIGERIRQLRLGLSLSQGELADQVGLDRTMINKIEAGSRRVNAFELSMLASKLGVAMDYFLRPVPQVISRRIAPITDDNVTDATRQAQRLDVALVGWLRDVQQLVELGLLQPPPILRHNGQINSEETARAAALWVRDHQNLGIGPIKTLMELAEQCGQFMLVTELPGDGASLIDGSIAAAVVSIQGDPGRRRATAAHELGHLIVGDEYSSDLGVSASRAGRERIINSFAAELLLPAQVLNNEIQQRSPVRDQIVRIAATYRTSWSLALRQAEQASIIDSSTRRQWSQRNPTHAELREAIGWAPQPDLESIRVPPGYAHAVMTAWKRGAVTASRAVELMHGQVDWEDWPADDDTDLAP